ncbi:hypothetical protein [Streptomyces sp. T028]|uniref:hypothetical protein n=1 Tax=Streptomyces sp. T028 TaxID=3394379 RepID=UPI003A8939FC
MTREQLVELARGLMASEGTEAEDDEMVRILEGNVPHPRVLDLIYHPELEGLTDSATAEEIVDVALACKSIAL